MRVPISERLATTSSEAPGETVPPNTSRRIREAAWGVCQEPTPARWLVGSHRHLRMFGSIRASKKSGPRLLPLQQKSEDGVSLRWIFALLGAQ